MMGGWRRSSWDGVRGFAIRGFRVERGLVLGRVLEYTVKVLVSWIYHQVHTDWKSMVDGME